MARAVMIQGTASNAGKSILTSALCRVLSQDGYLTAPFKSQNMSQKSYFTRAGREIAAIQAVQAEAAGVRPEVSMNPILMKPLGDDNSEIILNGKPYQKMKAAAYFAEKDKLLEIIRKAVRDLKNRFDILVLEGGGNPAEINLRDKDLVNMKAAEIADAPVILAADIDKGGVFASIVGTLELLRAEERARVKGIIINKFRGDPQNFSSGVELIEDLTGIKVLGVFPYLEKLNLPAEDSLDQDEFLSTEDNLDQDELLARNPKNEKAADQIEDSPHKAFNQSKSHQSESNHLDREKISAQIRDENFNYLAAEFRKHIDLAELYKIIFAD